MKMMKISEYSIKEPSFQQQPQTHHLILQIFWWILLYTTGCQLYCKSHTKKKRVFQSNLQLTPLLFSSDHWGASVGPTGATARPPGRNKRTNQSCQSPPKIPKGLRFDYPALRSSWDFCWVQVKMTEKWWSSCAIWHTYLMWNLSVERSPPANGWLSNSHLHLLQSSAAMYQVEGLHTLKCVPMIWLFGDFLRSKFLIFDATFQLQAMPLKKR